MRRPLRLGGVGHRRARVAERRVHQRHQRVHRRRLPRPRRQQARAAAGQQVAREGGDRRERRGGPRRGAPGRFQVRLRRASGLLRQPPERLQRAARRLGPRRQRQPLREEQLGRQGPGHGQHLARRHRPAVVGHRAGQREVRLEDVEPVGRQLGGIEGGGAAVGAPVGAGGRSVPAAVPAIGRVVGARRARVPGAVRLPPQDPPPVREQPRVAQRLRVGAEQVGVEVHDHRGAVEVGDGAARHPEGGALPLALAVARGRLVLAPARLRVGDAQAPAQIGHGGRRGGLAQHIQPSPTGPPQRREVRPRERQEVVPGGGRPGGRAVRRAPAALPPRHPLAAVGVVQLEHARLREHVGRAQAGRVLGVALHLDGPAVVAGHQQRRGHAGQLEQGGEALRLPRHELGRVVGERQDLLLRPAAAGQAGQGDRGAHDLQEPPAREAVGVGAAGVPVPARQPLEPQHVGRARRVGRRREALRQQPPVLGRLRQLRQAAPIGPAVAGVL